MSGPGLSMFYSAKGLQFAWERRGTFVFVVFTLLSLIARLLLWPKFELLFAVIAVSLFSFAVSPAGVWVGTAPIISRSPYSNTLWSNAPELSLGVSAVARGETMLAKSTLIGFVLCNTLWVLGISLFGVGVRQHIIRVNRIVSTMTGLCLLASSLVTILVLLDVTVVDTRTVHPSTDKTIFLSRGIAVACLLLWAGFLFFRKHTPASFGSEGLDPSTPSNSDDRSATTNPDPDSLNPIENLIQASIRLALLGFCADSIVHSLLIQPIFARSVYTYLAIPLTARLWAQYRGVRSIQHSHNDTDTFEEVIDSSIGAVLNSLLFVAPCLVLLGGIIGVPMNLRFSVMEVALVDVAVWTLSLLIPNADGVWFGLHYYKGAVLMSLYVMSALGLYMTL